MGKYGITRGKAGIAHANLAAFLPMSMAGSIALDTWQQLQGVNAILTGRKMVDSKGGVNQVHKLMELLGERLFPEQTRWMYYVGGAVAGMISTLILVYFSIVIPFYNYVLVPYYIYVPFAITTGMLLLHIYLWKRRRAIFCKWNMQCSFLLYGIFWLVAALADFLQSDINAKISGVMAVLSASGWFGIWCISCYEASRERDGIDASIKSVLDALANGQIALRQRIESEMPLANRPVHKAGAEETSPDSSVGRTDKGLGKT